MFRTVIAGVDGGEGGDDAIALAARLAALGGGGGELVLVHAYPYASAPHIADAGFGELLRGEALALLEQARERAGVEAAVVPVADTSPGRALHRVAEEHAAGLIVVGPSHRSKLGQVVLGSQATSALHGAPVPVAVATRGPAREAPGLEMIGVGFDASPEARLAFDLATGVARSTGAQLHLLRSVSGALFAPYGAVYDWNLAMADEHERAQAAVDAAIAGVDVGGRGEVVVDDPVRALRALSGQVDLLVLGSRGYGPLRRLLVGSTAAGVIGDARCPVVVVPRPSAEPAGKGTGEPSTTSA